MKYLNRAAMVVKPKEPYLQWARQVSGDTKLVSSAFQEDCSVFLIPELSGSGGPQGVLRKEWRRIFEFELESWHRDPDGWPKPLTYEMFRQWFDVEVHSELIDLAGKPLDLEEM